MAGKSDITLVWPGRGVCKAQGYPKQPPFTAPDALNVRPYDTQEVRAHGGSRPGLADVWTDTTGDTIQTLAEATVLNGTASEARALVIASGSLWVEQSGGTLYEAGGSMNTTAPLQVATWGQKAYIADYGSGRLAKVCDLTSGTPSVSNWTTGFYTLKRFTGPDSTVYPLFRRDEVLTYYFDDNDVKYPGWPYTTTYQPYEGSLTLQDGTVVTEADQLLLLKWGASGTANGEFDQPFGIAIDSTGRVIVTDSSNNRVQIFSQDGEWLATFGSAGTGDGQFDEPRGVCVDSSDNIYVVDAGNNRIQKFTSQGVYSAKVGASGTGNGQFDNPRFIVTDDTYVYVTDAQNDRVQKFTVGLVYDSQWGTTGTGNGQFDTPRGIAFHSSGNLWVCDSGNDRVQEFTTTGTYVSQWSNGGTSTKEPGKFNICDALVIDSDDNFYITDTTDGRTQKFEDDGTFLWQFGRTGDADGEFSSPVGLAVNSANSLYVCDNGNDRIQKMATPDSLPFVTIDTEDNIRDYTAGSSLNYESGGVLTGIYKGTVPTDCTAITRWQDRLVMANGTTIYFSRAGDPNDWDYGADSTDVGRATFTSSTADSGGIGEPVTALVSFSDNFLLVGCKTSLWVLRGGSPTAGGRFDNLSRAIGIIGENAWCDGPSGEVLFLSLDGLYGVSPLSNGQPTPLSRPCLPEDLRGVDTDAYTVSMAYSPYYHGVNIFLRPTAGGGTHYWVDWPFQTFWPETYATGHEPRACARVGNAIYVGCNDGVVRQYSDAATDDDGTAFLSYVMYGPFPIRDRMRQDYLLRELRGYMESNSSDVTWEVYSGETAQQAVSAAIAGSAPEATGTWSAGFNKRTRPRARGAYFVIKVKRTTAGRWTIENIDCSINVLGEQRKG